MQVFFVLLQLSFLSQSENSTENAKPFRRVFVNLRNLKPQVCWHRV